MFITSCYVNVHKRRTTVAARAFSLAKQSEMPVLRPRELPRCAEHSMPAAGREHPVFFDVGHSGVADAVLLFVQSAFPATLEKGSPHGAKRKKVGLRVLVNHALRGTTPRHPHKGKPRHRGGVCTPILLVIPRLVRTLVGGQTRYRLLRHAEHCTGGSGSMQGGTSATMPAVTLSVRVGAYVRERQLIIRQQQWATHVYHYLRLPQRD